MLLIRSCSLLDVVISLHTLLHPTRSLGEFPSVWQTFIECWRVSWWFCNFSCDCWWHKNCWYHASYVWYSSLFHFRLFSSSPILCSSISSWSCWVERLVFFCKYFIFTTLKVLPTVHGRCSQLSSSICKTLDLKSIGPVLGKGFSHKWTEKLCFNYLQIE